VRVPECRPPGCRPDHRQASIRNPRSRQRSGVSSLRGWKLKD